MALILPMGKITHAHIKETFEIATQVYDGILDRKKGLDILSSKGMNGNSASDYINNYKCMRNGKIFTRTSNVYSTKYFLGKIYSKYGLEGLEKALMSLSYHLEYYEQKSNAKVVKKWKVYNNYLQKLKIEPIILFPNEGEEKCEFLEGKSKKVLVNLFERCPAARKKCVDHYGYKCAVFVFDFKAKYGEIGNNFIHVHHIVDISLIDKEYVIDPLKDLIPVCPNCHAMLHKRKPAYSIDELKDMVHKTKKHFELSKRL